MDNVFPHPSESGDVTPDQDGGRTTDPRTSADTSDADPVRSDASNGDPIVSDASDPSALGPSPPDPGPDVPDPENELPNVPSVSSPDPGDAPARLSLAFWWLVLVCNGALLALWVGMLFVVFEGNWDLGGRLLAVGGVLSAYALYKYRTFPDLLGEKPEDGGGPDPETGATDARNPESSPDSDHRDPEPATESDHRDPRSTPTPDHRDVPDPARRVLSAAHDDRSLGLLVELVDRGPVAVRSLASDYDLCESDLHGLLAEFSAAGLIEETTIAGERGYEPTEVAVEGIDHLREARYG